MTNTIKLELIVVSIILMFIDAFNDGGILGIRLDMVTLDIMFCTVQYVSKMYLGKHLKF